MATTGPGFYTTGGALRPDAPSYIERKADAELLECLRQGEFCYVLTPRQMGKSSLMARTAVRLREQGVAVAFLDPTAIGRNLTVEQWYDGLLRQLGRHLSLEAELEQFWRAHERLGPLERWIAALEAVVLPGFGVGCSVIGVREQPAEDPTPKTQHRVRLVIFIDEIDAVRSLPFSTDELFAAIRQCYNRRTQDPAFEDLAFCLLGVATPSDLIQDTRTTPFNIGRRIELTDFTPAEAAPLAQGLAGGDGLPTRAKGEPATLLGRVLYWTGGHPYLTQRLCRAVAELDASEPNPKSEIRNPKSVDRLCAELFLSPQAREQDDNLLFVRERLLRSEADVAGLLELYGQVRSGKQVALDDTNQLVSILRLSGITRVVASRLRVRNRIYERVFDRNWITQHMPGAELRRQQAAYRRGLLRATAGAAVILAVVGALALVAVGQTRLLRRHLYAAQMNLAQQAWEAGDVERARSLLEAQRPKWGQEDLRGFEWRHLWPLCQHGGALSTLRGHEATVNGVAYSPDGRLLASSSDDRTIKLWDAATSREIGTLQGHRDGVGGLAFSPDGHLLASGSGDGTVKLWDVSSRRELVTLKAYKAPVAHVAFSPDGETLAARTGDGTIKLWTVAITHSVAYRRELATLPGSTGRDWWQSIAFSPDSQILAAAGTDRIDLWDVRSRRRVAVLKGHNGLAAPLAFAPNGQTLASGGDDGTVRLWDLATRQQRAVLRGHIDIVLSVTYSPDGSTVASGGQDGTIRLWNPSTQAVMRILRGHTNHVLSVAFSPDGKTLASGSEDGTVRLWAPVMPKEADRIQGPNQGLSSVVFSPNGKRLAASGMDGSVKIWDFPSRHETATPTTHMSQVIEVAFSPNGQLLAGASWNDRRVKLWNAANGRQVAVLSGQQAQMGCVGFSHDGKLIAAGDFDGTVFLWDVATRELVNVLRGHGKRVKEEATVHGKRVEQVAFSPDDRMLASGARDKIRLWDLTVRAPGGREIGSLPGHTDAVRSVQFSPDGKRLASGSNDGTIKLWDVSSKRCVGTLRGHAFVVGDVAFSPDGRELASASGDGTIKHWNLAMQREVGTLKGHMGSVEYVSFSPDGNTLASASLDATVRLWHAATFAETDAPDRAESHRSSP